MICTLGLSENHACHTRFLDGAPKECGVDEERRSRPSRVALNHATKELNSTMIALSGSAPGHMLLLPPIHIPQALLPLCSHPYSDPTRLVLHGERQAPGRAASASEECSRLQGGRLQLIELLLKREIQSQQQISTNQLTANG